jgi:PAS domain S-box-containing protein
LTDRAFGSSETIVRYGAADISVLDRLEQRASRDTDYGIENSILSALADELAGRPENLLQKLTDVLVEQGIGQSAGISLREAAEGRDGFRWVALSGDWGRYKDGAMPFDASPCGIVIRENTVLLLDHPERYFPDAALDPLIHEVLLVPFHSAGAPVGTLWVTRHREGRAFEREDVRLLTSLARFAAAGCKVADSLREARAEEEVSRAALAADIAGLHRLHELYAKLASETDLMVALSEILAAAVELTGTDRGVLQLVSDDGQRLEFAVHHGYGEGTNFTEHFRYQGVHVACESARRHRQRIIIEDVATFPGLAGTPDAEVALAEDIRATQSTPMLSRTGELIGVLNTQFRQPHRPSERELRLIDMLAWTAAGFVERHSAANAALRESEIRFRELGAASSDVIWIRDADTLAMEYLSPAFATVYGASCEPYVGTGPDVWLSLVHPEDRADFAASIDRLRAGERVRHEFRVVRPSDDAVRWIRNTDFPIRDDKGRLKWIGGIGQDVSEEKANAARLRLLVAELQHRVRNMLTVVRSVFSRTVETGGSIDEIADHFKGRLDALARTQVIVTKTSSGLVDLENLVRDELLSVGASDGPTLSIDGPDVTLPPKTAESIGLALHELTTNAVKYGALKTPGATLDIRWSVNVGRAGAPRLDLLWTERGVPAVSVNPTREGFGRELIEEALPYRLGAETKLEFRGGGVRCAISVPLPHEAATPLAAEGS